MTEFKMNISTDDLKRHSLFIATPTYDGKASTAFMNSMIQLGMMCATYGINVKFSFITNESLIPRARNILADEFMRSDMTHLMFIDADIKFDPMSVLMLLGISVTHPDQFDVLAAPYTKKKINWEKVAYYFDKVEDKKDLAMLSGEFAFNMADENQQMTFDRPFEVTAAGTGFMLIPKYVLTAYSETYSMMKYRPDHTNIEHFSGDREVTAFFHCDIDPVSKRYLSEDYYFCFKAREMGKKVHLVPWIELSHNGNIDFTGSLMKEFEAMSKLNQNKEN